jgi:hypothetical protein
MSAKLFDKIHAKKTNFYFREQQNFFKQLNYKKFELLY